MKVINFRFVLLAWTFSFVFCFSNVNAQKTQQENSVCSELKNAGLSVAADKVLVVEEVFAPQIVKVREQPFTLAESIAIVGGFNRTASIKNIHIFKCTSNAETAESIIVTNFEKIKKGIDSKIILKGGEIVLVLDKDSKKLLQ